MEKNSRIFVAGSETFIGSGIVRALDKHGYRNQAGRAGAAPNLRDAGKVDAFFRAERPEYVFHATGEISGIGGNLRAPADLMLDNLVVNTNIIASAHRHGTRKLLYVASGCTYPKLSPQPMRAEHLLTGVLEPSSEYYATAKIAGMKLCQAYKKQYGANFISVIPANPFGAGDDFDPENAHVIGALMSKMHQAKMQNGPSVTLWGTGSPRRDFIFVDDLGDACVFVMNRYDGLAPFNVGCNTDVAIRDLAVMIKELVGYAGELTFDASKPDGMPLKLVDASELISMGWRPATPLREALNATYRWFLGTQKEKKQAVQA